MKYAALHGTFVRFAAAGASDAALGAWARVMVLASELELQDPDDPSAARVAGAAGWDDRRWISATGTDKAGILAAVGAGLVAFDGEDLLVFGYDAEGHQKTATLRDNGRFGKLGGRPKGRVTAEKPSGLNPQTQEKPSGLISKTPSPLLSSPSLTLPGERAREAAPEKPATEKPAPERLIPLVAQITGETAFARGVTPAPEPFPSQMRTAARRVQELLDRKVFPDAESAVRALVEAAFDAVKGTRRSYGLALTDATVAPPKPEFRDNVLPWGRV